MFILCSIPENIYLFFPKLNEWDVTFLNALKLAPALTVEQQEPEWLLELGHIQSTGHLPPQKDLLIGIYPRLRTEDIIKNVTFTRIFGIVQDWFYTKLPRCKCSIKLSIGLGIELGAVTSDLKQSKTVTTGTSVQHCHYKLWGAAIAQWIRRTYRPATPGSCPKHTIYAFIVKFVVYLS